MCNPSVKVYPFSCLRKSLVTLLKLGFNRKKYIAGGWFSTLQKSRSLWVWVYFVSLETVRTQLKWSSQGLVLPLKFHLCLSPGVQWWGREPSGMQTANLEPGCWFWIMLRYNSPSKASFLWHVAWFCGRERKEIRKWQTLKTSALLDQDQRAWVQILVHPYLLQYFWAPEDIGRKDGDLWNEHNRTMLSLISLLSWASFFSSSFRLGNQQLPLITVLHCSPQCLDFFFLHFTDW